MLLFHIIFLFTFFSFSRLNEGYCEECELKKPKEMKLETPLEYLDALIIVGVPNYSEGFEVNFMIDKPTPEIAFHFNPRFHSKTLVVNTRLDGGWGKEEVSKAENDFPFQVGQPFFLEIHMGGRFWVAVNGVSYLAFTHRAPLKDITSIQVKRVKLREVILRFGRTYPVPVPEYIPCSIVQPKVVYSDIKYKAEPEPLLLKLTSSLRPLSSLVIEGKIPDHYTGFTVSLLVDDGESQDIAFHFKAVPYRGYTTRNSKLGGNWGKEEGNREEKFPFKNGSPFHLEIFFAFSELKVAVNGEHYYSFKYRIPLRKVTSVQVEGVPVRHVLINTNKCHSSVVQEYTPQLENKHSGQGLWNNDVSIIDLMVPFVHEFKTGLQLQSSIFVVGVVYCTTARWELNIMKGREGSIGLHFNPRLKEENFTAINNLPELKGNWGDEIRCYNKPFPFAPGQYFWMEIFLAATEFKIAVNGAHYCSFPYRAPLCSFTSVEVCGVKNVQVGVQPGTSYPSIAPFEVSDGYDRCNSNTHLQISPRTSGLAMHSRNITTERRNRFKQLLKA